MKSKRLITNNISKGWNIHFDKVKNELFVPEFCVYLFVIMQGEMSFVGQDIHTNTTSNTLICIPPLPFAIQLRCNQETIVEIYKVDAWYFISHLFMLQNIKTLQQIQPNMLKDNNLMEYLQELHLAKAPIDKTEIIKRSVELKTNLLSDKQINRYLKLWFGLTLSQLRKIHEVESFVKQDCKFGEINTTLINNVDYDSFYDYSHFGHTFKTVTGMTPEAYLSNEGTIQSLFW